MINRMKVMFMATAIGISSFLTGCGVTQYNTRFGATNTDEDKNEWLDRSVTGERIAIDGLDLKTQTAVNKLVAVINNNQRDLADARIIAPEVIEAMGELRDQISLRNIDRAVEKAEEKYEEDLLVYDLLANHEIYMKQLSEATKNIQEQRTRRGRGINYRYGDDALIHDPVINQIMFDLRRYDSYRSNSHDQRSNVHNLESLAQRLDQILQNNLTRDGQDLLRNLSTVVKISAAYGRAAYGDINLERVEERWNEFPPLALEIVKNLVLALKDDDRYSQENLNEYFDAINPATAALSSRAESASSMKTSLVYMTERRQQIVQAGTKVIEVLELYKHSVELVDTVLKAVQDGDVKQGYDVYRP